MHSITLLNEKGGVGKTTLATHIATGLAIRGYRVVLVDADPQGHATVGLGIAKTPGLYNLLIRDAEFSDVLVPINPQMYGEPEREVKGQLYLLPSNLETRAIPLMTSDGMIVLKRFSTLRDAIDVVIFDTSPTPSLLHSAIYMSTNFILYPTECEFLSLDGLNESLNHRDQAQPRREQYGLGRLEVMGIVPTKYRSATVLHNQNLEYLRTRYGNKVWKPLTLRTIWGEASQRRRPIFNVAPDSKAAKEVWSVVHRVEEQLA